MSFSSGAIRAWRRSRASPEDRRPLDLEEERDLVADVPDGIDLRERRPPTSRCHRGTRCARDRREGRRASRARVGGPARAPRARRACPADGRRRRSSASRSLCCWLRVRRSSRVTRRSGVLVRAPVALQARPDERLVGQVVTGEHRGDPLVERGLGHGTGRGQQAEHGPLHAIRQGRRRSLHVGRLAEPPAAGLDLDDASLRGTRRARRG